LFIRFLILDVQLGTCAMKQEAIGEKVAMIIAEDLGI
jgi:hypothetical protein